MGFLQTVLLGTVAGFTIYLGLPFARMKNLSRGLRAFLNSLATGILVFLLWDIISKAVEPITIALGDAQKGSPGTFIVLLVLFIVGFGFGLLSLVYFEGRYIKKTGKDNKTLGTSPLQLSIMIAIGIGLHNFSEGLAIGQAAATNAITLATILIIGFGAHNATEGFGIAAPLTTSENRPSWRFIGLVGLIGGGPTFLGTLLGFSIHSEAIFVLFLSLAAGSIFYVISELLNVGRGLGVRQIAMWGIFLGFFLGFGTDLILTWAGV
jgi:zinc transporter, ZIP family